MIIKIMSREFDDEKINPSNKLFDKQHAKEYEDFLVSIPETDVIKLPVSHAYTRVKLISMIEQPEMLRKAGYRPQEKPTNNEPKLYNKPIHIAKNWHDK